MITTRHYAQHSSVEEEYIFDNKTMIVDLDTRGLITYASREFLFLSGYSREELIGRPLEAFRHSDMPLELFNNLWQHLNADISWDGILKNVRKDGRYYYVAIWVKPKYDKWDNLVGYIGRLTKPDYSILQSTLNTYRVMKQKEMMR